MDTYHFTQVSDIEYNVIILCAEIMQRNIDCFDDIKGKLLVGASISQTINKLKTHSELSPVEFTAALHSIELCALALSDLERINPQDYKKIQPYKKHIKELYRVYCTLLYL